MSETEVDNPAAKPDRDSSVESASAWVLRIGVCASVAVMLIGLVFSFIHGPPSLERMMHDPFEYRPSAIYHGISNLRGKAIIELGIYILVFTPITRVFMSFLLFAFDEHDRLYAIITLIVLLLTLVGLLFLG